VTIGGQTDAAWQDRFADWSRAPVDALAAREGWLAHEPGLQTRFKASFTLPAGADWQAARRAVDALAMVSKVVISGTGEIDILPASAGKGEATLHLACRLDIALPNLIVAGDSGNDVDMFVVAPRGIVVGNARDELKHRVRRDGVFFATQRCAAGIIEGLRHFGVVSQRPPGA
jgi:hydroxymethylpyrimidine pyrophosphatase-like HAD family hydrolase